MGEGDQDAWRRLFAAYCQFYEQEVTEDHFNRVWSWIHDSEEVRAILVVPLAGSGEPVGLAHLRPWVRPLRGEVAGYLDDLFVDPGARGSGAVKALFEAIEAIAEEEGWGLVRWATAKDNQRARGLYERIATQTDWITYDMAINGSAAKSRGTEKKPLTAQNRGL